jgi:hypothetical protein
MKGLAMVVSAADTFIAAVGTLTHAVSIAAASRPADSLLEKCLFIRYSSYS